MKRVRVFRDYRSDVVIPAGEYAANDDALFSRTRKLIAEGYAEIVASEPPTAESEVVEIEVDDTPKPRKRK